MFLNSKKTITTKNAHTTSTLPSAQENFTNATKRNVLQNDTTKNNVSVLDNKGAVQSTPQTPQWTVSKSGQITIYEPVNGQIISNNSLITGETTLPVVNYRILDDVSGMISQGQLSVVGGKFSASVNLSTNGAKGSIELYGADNSGKEFSNIRVPIRFK